MKRLLYILFGVLVLISTVTFPVFAVGVQPMEIKISGKPGAIVPFKVTVMSVEKTPVTIKVSLAQTIQKLNGAYDFRPANPETSSEAKWIDFNNADLVIPKGGQKEITGTVKIPLKAKGFRLFSILVEQPSAKKTESLNLSVIYAVRLEINVDFPVPRPTARVSDFEMVQGPKGEPCLQFKTNNSSLIPFATNASVSVRNSLTKRLIEKVQLRPAFYWENHYEPVILADSSVQFIGTPMEALLPGKYDLQLFFRYAASGQILLSKSVEVKTGDYVYSAQQLRITKIEPDNIVLTGRPGGTVMKGIKLVNKSNKPVKVLLGSSEINTDYPYSIFKNTIVEFKNGREFLLKPGRMAVAIIMVNLPKNSPVQGNYGLLKVMTFATDGNPNPIEQFEINLEAVISGEYVLSAETTDLVAVRDNDRLLLSVVIKNTGNIKITPKCTIYLKDRNGKSADTIELTTQGDDNSVLPLKLITLSGTTNEKLTPDDYKAEVKIFQENKMVGNSIIDLQVK